MRPGIIAPFTNAASSQRLGSLSKRLDLVKGLGPQQITLSVKAIKHFVNFRMTYRAIFPIREQILLADVGGVVTV